METNFKARYKSNNCKFINAVRLATNIVHMHIREKYNQWLNMSNTDNTNTGMKMVVKWLIHTCGPPQWP